MLTDALFYKLCTHYIYYVYHTRIPLKGLGEQDDHELLEFVFVGGLDRHHGGHVTQLEFGQQMVECAQARYQVAETRRRLVATQARVSEQASNFFQRLSQCPGQGSHGAAFRLPVHYAGPRRQTLHKQTNMQ